MSGIFGEVSEERCVEDLFWGTHYLQHRAQDYCGLALHDEKGFGGGSTHHGLLKQSFPKERRRDLQGNFGIGCVSSDRQPISELSGTGGLIIDWDGNVVNYEELKDNLLREGATFSGFREPEEISDTVLISKIIASEVDFTGGVKKLAEMMKGDFAIVALAREGIYAARGWGRKPLILGKKDGSYVVSSESTSFENRGFEIVRDVKPGEIVLLNQERIQTLENLNLSPIKYGTFEWVYAAYPTSVIDGKSVAEVRMNLGKLLAKRYPIEADLVSPIPNSGRWHAIGYAIESGLPYLPVFARYDYSDKSYTPQEQDARDEEARTKLIRLSRIADRKKIVLLDDSIVRGTQTLNQVSRLTERDYKAAEVHARIACPPLIHACIYGKTTKKDEDCIARRMDMSKIQEALKLDSLGYATVADLEKAIGYKRDKLCLECWVD